MTSNEKNAFFDKTIDFRSPTQKPSAEMGASAGLVEAFENGLGDTIHDVLDMKRLGKKQEFRVRRPLFPRCVRLTEML